MGVCRWESYQVSVYDTHTQSLDRKHPIRSYILSSGRLTVAASKADWSTVPQYRQTEETEEGFHVELNKRECSLSREKREHSRTHIRKREAITISSMHDPSPVLFLFLSPSLSPPPHLSLPLSSLSCPPLLSFSQLFFLLSPRVNSSPGFTSE